MLLGVYLTFFQRRKLLDDTTKLSHTLSIWQGVSMIKPKNYVSGSRISTNLGRALSQGCKQNVLGRLFVNCYTERLMFYVYKLHDFFDSVLCIDY